MLNAQTAEAIKAWVARGGRLISEGCPAYFGNLGRAGEHQPNYGLDELFGVKQQDVQFTPDLLEKLQLKMDAGYRVCGGVYLQSYRTTTGRVAGRFEDGRIAVVDNVFGKGRTRLVGTFPGYGYAENPDDDTKRFFADLLPWAGETQHVTSSDSRIIVRVQANPRSTYLWAVNSQREAVQNGTGLVETLGAFSRVPTGMGRQTADERRSPHRGNHSPT